MIDLRAARADPEGFRSALERKGAGEAFDELLAADERWRELETQASELRAQTKTKGKPTPEQLEQLRELKAELQRVEAEHEQAAQSRQELLDRVPNPPDPSVPDGAAEEDAVELRRVGEPPTFSFEPRDHLELAAAHGWIDLERAARVSGARFAYRVGEVALLELALYRFALDRLVEQGLRAGPAAGAGAGGGDVRHGLLADRRGQHLQDRARRAVPHGHVRGRAGLLPHGRGARRAAAPLRRLLDQLPARGGRGRQGHARNVPRAPVRQGRDVRLHCSPGARAEEHDALLALEEELVQEVGLPYRVVNVAAGDLGASAAKKYDIEAWFPSQQRYREITSTSNTTDYQARRLGIRFRRDGKLEPVHTLNGTAMTARWVIALLENFQDEGGEIAVPEVLTQFGAPPRLA